MPSNSFVLFGLKLPSWLVKMLLIGLLLCAGAFFLFREQILHYYATKDLPLEKINESSSAFTDLIKPTVFNIEDFGGSRDSDDNSEALQKAINAAIITNVDLRPDDKWDIYSGRVYIPSGQWNFKKGIASKVGVEIFGDGVGKTYLRYNGDGVFLDFSDPKEKFDLKIKHLFIEQTNGKATAISFNQVNRNSGIWNVIVEGGHIGIHLLNCYTTTFDSFFIYDTKGFGILGENATNTDFKTFKIENCTVGAKFTRSETNSSTGLKFIGGVIQGSRDEGLILSDLTNFTSYSTFFEGNGRNPGKSQIYITSELDGIYDNDVIAFYAPFITGGYSSSENSTAVWVENTTHFVFNECFIRANDRINTAITLGSQVVNAEIQNGRYSGIENPLEVQDERTNLIYDPHLRSGRGYGRQFMGLGAESSKEHNRHYFESYQTVVGHSEKGKVGIGTFNGKPGIQAFGKGSSYELTTNPKVGDHNSAPAGITKMAGVKYGTVVTGSSFTTNKKVRNILVNTTEGKRTVTLRKEDEQLRRELVLKNVGNQSNDLVVRSSTTTIEGQNPYVLKDGEAITIVFDGAQWYIISKLMAPL